VASVATLAFEVVQGPQFYRVEPELANLPLRSPMIGLTRFGAAVGRLVARPEVAGSAELPTETAWLAAPEDVRRSIEDLVTARSALARCRQLTERHDLPMDFCHSFLALDHAQLTFFFTAPGRVDFRGLLRDLVHEFHTPIRLEQVGERDVARLLGGMGRCGRVVCCQAWMSGFEPVSMKHAKAQDLAPVPGQLGGLCGKLRCCLRFELECEHAAHRRCGLGQTPVKTAAWRWYEDEAGPLDPD
jgi:cell fate regulator YaaT (PSP1 superfamily)